jgi:hypothetical protein
MTSKESRDLQGLSRFLFLTQRFENKTILGFKNSICDDFQRIPGSTRTFQIPVLNTTF